MTKLEEFQFELGMNGEYILWISNVAPITYGAGLGYSFLNHFYGKVREDLRPSVDYRHVRTNENKGTGVIPG